MRPSWDAARCSGPVVHAAPLRGFASPPAIFLAPSRSPCPGHFESSPAICFFHPMAQLSIKLKVSAACLDSSLLLSLPPGLRAAFCAPAPACLKGPRPSSPKPLLQPPCHRLSDKDLRRSFASQRFPKQPEGSRSLHKSLSTPVTTKKPRLPLNRIAKFPLNRNAAPKFNLHCPGVPLATRTCSVFF